MAKPDTQIRFDSRCRDAVYSSALDESCTSLDPDSLPSVGSGETILLVEDESALREMTADLLTGYGFEIFAAGSGPEAVEIWSENKARISLLFTDVVMPLGLSGIDIAERFRTEKPSLKVIYTSGYQLDTISNSKTIQSSGRFISKPYMPSALAKLIRETLDDPEPLAPQ